MKRTGLSTAMAIVMSSWTDGNLYPFCRRGVSLPIQPQTEEEAQRRIQAAADRRAKRNAKRVG